MALTGCGSKEKATTADEVLEVATTEDAEVTTEETTEEKSEKSEKTTESVAQTTAVTPVQQGGSQSTQNSGGQSRQPLAQHQFSRQLQQPLKPQSLHQQQHKHLLLQQRLQPQFISTLGLLRLRQ